MEMKKICTTVMMVAMMTASGFSSNNNRQQGGSGLAGLVALPVYIAGGTIAATTGLIYWGGKELSCAATCTNGLAARTAPILQGILGDNPYISFRELYLLTKRALNKKFEYMEQPMISSLPQQDNISSILVGLSPEDQDAFFYSLKCLKNCKATFSNRYTCKMMEYMRPPISNQDIDIAKTFVSYGYMLAGTSTILGGQTFSGAEGGVTSKLDVFLRSNGTRGETCLSYADSQNATNIPLQYSFVSLGKNDQSSTTEIIQNRLNSAFKPNGN